MKFDNSDRQMSYPVKLILENPKSFLIVISALFFFPLLGSYPVLGQWEPHYGRVAMEMINNPSFDWFLDPVYLGKHNFWSKPIFCFWMVIPFVMTMGPTELALRLPFAINGVLFVLLIHYITLKLFNDRKRALLSGFIAVFIPFTYLITRQFMWDIAFVTFLTGSIGFLYLGQRDKNRKLLRTAYLFMGLGMLTKGLLAVFLPAAIIGIWMIVSADYSEGIKKAFSGYVDYLRSLHLLEGLIIFLISSAWWYIYMAAKHGMPFLNEFFGKHHFGRLEGTIKKPDGPFEFYLWQLGIGAFPWVGFFIPGLYLCAKKARKQKEELFVLVSFSFIFLFFTLAATKFPHYIFPAIPFMIMITSTAFLYIFEGESNWKTYPVIGALAALTVGIIGKDLGTGMNYADILYIITTHKVQSWFGRVYDMLPYLTVFVPIMVAFILLPIIMPSKKWLVKTGLAGFFITAIAWSGYVNFYWVPNMLEVFTPKKIVDKYFELKKPGDIIVDYDNWKNRSMYFYLGLDEKLRRVSKIRDIKQLIKNNPDNTVYISVKDKKVSELRAELLLDPGVPIKKIMDDKVDTYKEIEFYSASMKDKNSEETTTWKKNILKKDQVPKNIEKINATLEKGTVKILGYKLNKNRFDPGEEIKITVYYEALKKIEKNWKIFFHFDVYRGALPHSFKLDDFPQKGFYPTSEWKVGEIIRDEFSVDVPKGHPGGGIKIYTGFYIDKKRMTVDKPKFNDGQNRFILGTFNVNIR